MRCLVACVLLALSVGMAFAQEAATEKKAVHIDFFFCDADESLDAKSPALQKVLMTFGVQPEGADMKELFTWLLEQTRDKPGEPHACAARVTNNTDKTVPITYANIHLPLSVFGETGEGLWRAETVETHAASPLTEWAGAKSLFAKGDTLAPGKSVIGVVYWELTAEQKKMRQHVEYVPPEGLGVKGKSWTLDDTTLAELHLKWTANVTTAPPPRPGKQRVLAEAGNVNDETPLMVGRPGKMQPPAKQSTLAHKNIVGDQTQQAMGGMGGMGGGMMGMPGMGGMGGMGGGGMMGMPGMGGMPGMPGMPGARTQPGMPGGMPGGMPAGGGRQPRRPGGGL